VSPLILGVNLQEWYQLGRVYGDMHGMELRPHGHASQNHEVVSGPWRAQSRTEQSAGHVPSTGAADISAPIQS
jgi:hypothetical protein